MGVFITFEGVEGCGKTTQIRLLAEHLTAAGQRVTATREPGGCPIADQVRAVLLDADNRAMTPTTELLLYAAARAQHVGEVIRPALERGETVLCDRFTDATAAYQSGGRGIDRNIIDQLTELACQGLRPDLTILLDVDAGVGLRRARHRIDSTSGPREERFELEDLSFHRKVRETYLELAAHEPGRFSVIDGSGSADDVFSRIKSVVGTRISPERHHAVR